MDFDETVKVTIERVRKTSDRIERYECAKCATPSNSTACESCPFGQVLAANVDYILTLQEIYRKAF